MKAGDQLILNTGDSVNLRALSKSLHTVRKDIEIIPMNTNKTKILIKIT